MQVNVFGGAGAAAVEAAVMQAAAVGQGTAAGGQGTAAGGAQASTQDAVGSLAGEDLLQKPCDRGAMMAWMHPNHVLPPTPH